MPLVGTHIIKSLKDFHVDPVLSPEQKAAVQGEKEGGKDFQHQITAKFYSHDRWEEGKGEKKRGEKREGVGRSKGKRGGKWSGGGGKGALLAASICMAYL